MAIREVKLGKVATVKGGKRLPKGINLITKPNVIFKAAERLSLDKSKPGAGVLRFDKKRVLTLKGATKATWARNEVYDETHIYGKRSNCAKNPDRGLYYAGIWQELGLKESDACTEWARNILL